jgi:hypothetical protein
VSLSLGAFVLNAFAFLFAVQTLGVLCGSMYSLLYGESIFMAILASDIAPTIPAAFRECAAGILPISPNPPVLSVKIAKKLLSASLRFKLLASLASWRFNVFVLHFEQRQCTNCTAADTREPSAAFAPIQRRAPSHPPTQNVNSADTSEPPASHFGGIYAQSAKLANFANQTP